MLIKKKTKFTVFKFLKNLAIIILINFNKRKAFRALSNFNVNAKLILYDFKLFNYVSVIIIN